MKDSIRQLTICFGFLTLGLLVLARPVLGVIPVPQQEVDESEMKLILAAEKSPR